MPASYHVASAIWNLLLALPAVASIQKNRFFCSFIYCKFHHAKALKYRTTYNNNDKYQDYTHC